MEFLGKGKSASQRPDLDSGLYQALAAGDLPGAWLLAKPCLERTDFEGLSASTAFNCGLCLYRLEEYEKALAGLRRPLNPQAPDGLERYGLIRTKWLAALCLLRLDRPREAAPAIRFLAQYHITI